MLLHDGRRGDLFTVQALLEILARLRGQGYRLVTVSELLAAELPPR